MLVYLDSSAIVKRYIKEAGTEIMDLVFEDAETGRIKLFFSIWNVGEVLGIFDRYKRRKLMSEGELKGAVGKFTNEFTKLATLRYLDVVPLYTNIIVDAIKLILEYHVYEADAIQMVSSKDSNCVLFLTADRKLVKVARSIGINAFDVEKEGEKIKDFVESCN